MIPLLIVAVILLILLVLLLIPVSFTLTFDENFDYTLKYGLIKIPLTSKGEEQTKTDEKKDNYFKKLVKEKGFSSAFSELCFYAKAFLEKIAHLLKHIKIKIFSLKIKVGEKDAAKTAISYGAINSAVFFVLGFLESNVNLKMKDIDISSDFNSSESYAAFRFKASLKPIFAILAAVSLIKIIIEFKNKEKSDNERQ